jgi:hypothetical protein
MVTKTGESARQFDKGVSVGGIARDMGHNSSHNDIQDIIEVNQEIVKEEK